MICAGTMEDFLAIFYGIASILHRLSMLSLLFLTLFFSNVYPWFKGIMPTGDSFQIPFVYNSAVLGEILSKISPPISGGHLHGGGNGNVGLADAVW